MGNEIKITFDNADDFYVGCLVKGRVLVTVSNPQKYSTISIDLMGGAEVDWSESQQTGLGRTKRVTHSNSVTYINAQKILWTKEYSPTDDLPVGSHAFPFEFQLPQDLPPTFEGAHGQMKYEFHVTAARSGLNRIARACLNVKDRTDLLRLHREPRSLDTDKNVSFFWHNVGTVIATCSVPRTGFSPGEIIPVNMHIVNQTSRTIHVSASLYRKESYITPDKVKVEEKQVAKVVSPQIRAGQLMPFHSNDLVIPKDAATTLRNCSCIEVEYDVVLKIVIPWSHNRTLHVPVVITNQAPPAPAQPVPQAQIRLTPRQTVGLLHAVIQQKQQRQTQQSHNMSSSRALVVA